MSVTKQLKVNKTNVQYKNILTKGEVHVVWERDKAQVQVSLVPDPPSPCIGSIPHAINQQQFNKQGDNLLHGILGHAIIKIKKI